LAGAGAGPVRVPPQDGSVRLEHELASFSLSGQFIENLALTGAAAMNGTGNTLANVLIGNGLANLLDGLGRSNSLSGGHGNDTLRGGGEADTLKGGEASDTFRLRSAGEANEVITDYAAAADTMEVSASGFGGGILKGMNLGTTGRFVSNLTRQGDAALARGRCRRSTPRSTATAVTGWPCLARILGNNARSGP